MNVFVLEAGCVAVRKRWERCELARRLRSANSRLLRAYIEGSALTRGYDLRLL